VIGSSAALIGPSAAPHGVARAWSPFGRFIAATTVSMYGDWMTTVAVVVALYQAAGATGSAGYVVVRVVPRLIGAIPGGALADRFGPARTIAGLSLVQALLAALLAGALHQGSVGLALGLVAVSQAVGAAIRPAQTALIPQLVNDSGLPRANALYLGTWSSSLMVGPAVAAPLVVLFGPVALIIIDAVSFVAIGLVTLTIRVTARVRSTSGTPRAQRGSRFEAARLVWSNRPARMLAAAYCASGLVMTAASACFAVAAVGVLGAPDRAGWLYASAGVGSVAGSALAARWGTRKTAGWIAIAVGSACELVALVAFAASPVALLGIAALAMCGAASSVWEAWGATALQRRSGPALLGRASAVVVSATYAGMIAGAVLAFATIEALGWRWTVVVAVAVAAVLLTVAMVPRAIDIPAAASDGCCVERAAQRPGVEDGENTGGVERTREQEPLAAVAAHGGHVRELLLGLDAFGDSDHLDGAEKPDDGLGEGAVTGVRSQTAYERLVDLHDIHGERAQIAERRISRAEVIDGDPRAGEAQALHMADREVAVGQ
jgi:MFS family permease